MRHEISWVHTVYNELIKHIWKSLLFYFNNWCFFRIIPTMYTNVGVIYILTGYTITKFNIPLTCQLNKHQLESETWDKVGWSWIPRGNRKCCFTADSSSFVQHRYFHFRLHVSFWLLATIHVTWIRSAATVLMAVLYTETGILHAASTSSQSAKKFKVLD